MNLSSYSFKASTLVSPNQTCFKPKLLALLPPACAQCYSLEAQLRALQLVFLMRSLNELLEYVSGKCAVLIGMSEVSSNENQALAA